MSLILQESHSPIASVHKKLDEFLREAAASTEAITVEDLKEMVETRAKVFLREVTEEQVKEAEDKFRKLKAEQKEKLDDVHRRMGEIPEDKRNFDNPAYTKLHKEMGALHHWTQPVAKAEDEWRSLRDRFHMEQKEKK